MCFPVLGVQININYNHFKKKNLSEKYYTVQL